MEMKAAVLHAPADLRIETVAVPAPGPGEVLVRVRAAGICGSDLERVMVTGTYSFPTIPGHEFSGEIVELGAEVSGFSTGDRVAVAPLIPCRSCDYCQQGFYGQCEHYNFLGSRTDGAFAQYVKVPVESLIPLPDKVDYFEGAAIEPCAVALHGIIRIGIKSGDTVAVLGCGAIGLFALQFAKILGATRVIAVDISPWKLEMAAQAGADECINGAQVDPVAEILRLTGGKGANVCCETAGVSVTQEQCIRAAAKQGRVLYLGTAHKDVVLPPATFEHMIRGEVTLTGAWNSYSAPYPGVEWRAVLDYIASGKLKISPFITHTFPLEQLPGVIADLAAHKFEFNKVMVTLD